MAWLVVIGFALIVYLANKQRPTNVRLADLKSPLTTDDLREVPESARSYLLNADLVLRDYLQVLDRGSISQSIRPLSDLPHAVADIKASILMIATFRASRTEDPSGVISRLREAYMTLAYFPPTQSEALAEWARSSKDREAALRAGRTVGPDSRSLGMVMQEAGRLKIEFEQDMEAIITPAVEER